MHPWRTLGPAIPRQVASPQSPLPFRQANQAYHRTYNPFNQNRKTPLTNGPYRDKTALECGDSSPLSFSWNAFLPTDVTLADSAKVARLRTGRRG